MNLFKVTRHENCEKKWHPLFVLHETFFSFCCWKFLKEEWTVIISTGSILFIFSDQKLELQNLKLRIYEYLKAASCWESGCVELLCSAACCPVGVSELPLHQHSVLNERKLCWKYYAMYEYCKYIIFFFIPIKFVLFIKSAFPLILTWHMQYSFLLFQVQRLSITEFMLVKKSVIILTLWVCLDGKVLF